MKKRIAVWLKLFWMFLKINILTTSGPASVGLLYKESVGTIMTEEEFVEAVGFSNVLPGSDALQLAMFVGYAANGVSGVMASLLGSILPPTMVMLLAVTILERFQKESWMQGFMEGLAPAVAMLIAVVAWQIFKSSSVRGIGKRIIMIAGLTAVALALGIPSPLVLLGAGILGIAVFR